MEPTSSPPGTGPRVHVLTVRRGVTTCSDRVLVQGSALDDVVVPDLDAPWEGLAVSATLSDGTDSYTPPRRDDGSWLVPWELTRHPGAVTVSLEGKDGDYALSRQVADCCCTTQRAIDAVNANVNEKFAAIEKGQLQQTIAAQQNQLNQLFMQQQLCGVVRYPNTTAYTAGANPFFGQSCCGGYGF